MNLSEPLINYFFKDMQKMLKLILFFNFSILIKSLKLQNLKILFNSNRPATFWNQNSAQYYLQTMSRYHIFWLKKKVRAITVTPDTLWQPDSHSRKVRIFLWFWNNLGAKELLGSMYQQKQQNPRSDQRCKGAKSMATNWNKNWFPLNVNYFSCILKNGREGAELSLS